MVRENNWRLIFCQDSTAQPTELYDLAKEIGETNNLAPEHPEVVASLTAKGKAWQQDLPGPRWRQKK